MWNKSWKFLLERYIKINYQFSVTPGKIQIVFEMKALEPLLCTKTTVRNFVMHLAVHGMCFIHVTVYIEFCLKDSNDI
jgi:hypothetical protein